MTNTTKQAVNRFLGWKLPNDFRPDAGIEFSPSLLQLNSLHGWPTGTNLFTADQARAMFEYCLQDTRADLVKPIQAEPFAWATFDGEGGHELCLYENNESYRIYYYARNGAKYEGWVKPLYSADTVRALQLEAIRKTLEECSLVNLSQAEIEAIKRLDEVFQDGEGYDVDKDMMKNLAHLGVIRHIGAARYEFTVIGNQILNRLLYIGGFNPEEILKGLTP